MTAPLHVLITGASSGIGRALALRYAADGAHLSLCARHAGRLAEVAALTAATAASVGTGLVDVTDPEAMATWIVGRDAARPIDVLIANAGIGGADSLAGPMGEQGHVARSIIGVNLLGAVNTLTPALPAMTRRRAGHVAVVGSIAGLSGLPDAPAYSASKAGLHAYGEALRRGLRRYGIQVSVVVPGFVDTPMSASLPTSRPFLWTAERAAARIARGIGRGERLIVFPWPLRLAMALRHVLPAAAFDALLTALTDGARARR